MTFHFLNDVFGLNLALEPTKGILQRLALLQSNFCQTHHPQTSTISDIFELTPFVWLSVELTAQNSKRVRGDQPLSSLNILQLVLIQPEIVAQFMDDRKADLFADFGLAGADRLNILLIEHDVIRPRR